MSYRNIVKRLRYVKDHVHVFLPEDHNDLVDFFRACEQELSDLVDRLRGAGAALDPQIDAKLDQLRSVLARMRYVKYGDWYFAQDHNLFVDAAKLIADLIDELKEVTVVGAPAEVEATGYERVAYRELTVSTAQDILDVYQPRVYYTTDDYLFLGATYLDTDFVEHGILYLLSSSDLSVIEELGEVDLGYSPIFQSRPTAKYVIIFPNTSDRRYFEVRKAGSFLQTIDERGLPSTRPDMVYPAFSPSALYLTVATAEQVATREFKVYIAQYRAKTS